MEPQNRGVNNVYRYSTKEWDENSGLYYFGARYYSPETGRWTQRDPAGIVSGLNLYPYIPSDLMGYPEVEIFTQRAPAGTVEGLNSYAYAGNDPVGCIDPDGRKIKWPRWLTPDLIKRINKAVHWAKNKDKFEHCLRLIEDRCAPGSELADCEDCCREIWAFIDVVMKWKNDAWKNLAEWKFHEACYGACAATNWPGKVLERPKKPKK